VPVVPVLAVVWKRNRRRRKTLVAQEIFAPHTFIRVTKHAMKEKQYAAYRMLSCRRQVAFFNAQIETQNEQPSSPLGDAN
jgi:hypothetical protein